MVKAVDKADAMLRLSSAL